MHIVLAYDIPDTKRRTRLRKVLLRFGHPVQYSVFEFDLTAHQLEQLCREVRRVMKAELDNVRYYVLCAACAKGAETFGGRDLVKERSFYVV